MEKHCVVGMNKISRSIVAYIRDKWLFLTVGIFISLFFLITFVRYLTTLGCSLLVD